MPSLSLNVYISTVYKYSLVVAKVPNHPMANLQHLNQVKNILNAFEDSEITAYQFLHGLLSTKTS